MTEDVLVIRASRRKCAFLLLGLLAFVSLGTFLVVRSHGGDVWIGWLTIAFFGAGIPAVLRELFDTAPRVVLDDAGVFDRTWGVGVIPWADIETSYVKSVQGNTFVCLVLLNPDAWLAKLSHTQRVLAKGNLATGFQGLNINLVGTNGDADLVQEFVLSRCGKPAQTP